MADKVSVEQAMRGGCPVMHKGDAAAAGGSEAGSSCPVMRGDKVNPDNLMLLEEKQKPTEGQKMPLPTERVKSTIPRAEFLAPHQTGDAKVWEYPSEQMFYNAMKRKGWKPQEEDMPTVVKIHNMVNERSWEQVMIWEKMHPETADKVKLKRFMGRPDDLSPKARLRQLLGYKPPFDRHDWIVDRDGKEVRYVIDFYNGHTTDERAGFYVDARPAVDDVGSFVDRVRMNFRKIFQ
eukprot:m.138576 g.138576  ORF g.138576 m.138576 type:complete len:235 (+) comp16633_c0_seq3:44-748(+)